MTTKHVLLFCLGIIAVIAGFDIYLYADAIPQNSITQITIRLSKEYQIIPWGIGFLMGYITAHFYDPKAQE